MPTSRQVRVVKGYIIPSRETVVAVMRSIRTQVKTDPAALAAFKKNPRAFLAGRGLPIDSQRELLQEEGVKTGGQGGKYDCKFTCVTTNCCCSNCCVSWLKL